MEREQDEAHPEALGPTLALVGKQVQTTSTEGAVLDLRFSDGSRLRFQPSGDFEAWQVVGGDPWGLVWCTTDGEVEASFRLDRLRDVPTLTAHLASILRAP